MRNLLKALLLVSIFSSCGPDKINIVDAVYIDSMINNYTQPTAIKDNESEMQFWLNRINPDNTGISNEIKYAALLVKRFQLTGDILSVIMADSILKKVDVAYAHKEAAVVMALFRNAILQHRFTEADSLLEAAKKTGIKPYESLTSSFDINFELGRNLMAGTVLKQMASDIDYGYQFRNARQMHYNGDIDSSIAAMEKAVELSEDNLFLKQAALSNAADLCVHSGNIKKAYALYLQSFKLNGADMHSIMGIGWISLVHDHNDPLAEKIFHFVHERTLLPDPLFKLVQLHMATGDKIKATQFALAYEQQVTKPIYGNMYNKYLIELYTGILNEPGKAEALALKELNSRKTPQTYAWYVRSLHSNKKTAGAAAIYKKYVSGKPLEGLELYWMGKLMLEMKKGYNAQQFFAAAYKNKYDLAPVDAAACKLAIAE